MSTPSFGVIFHPRFPTETLADFARKAESAGFDELWLWDDCFLPGALTAAAIALSATQNLKVGIGLMPVTACNPLFVSMELTGLARAFPGRILPGFGHGVASWLTQIGASQSSLATLADTVTSVRRLLAGELVTTHGEVVNLEQVQMQMLPRIAPPLYIGAMRARSLRLAGRIGDGSILTGMSSPAYIRWARAHIQAGMAESGRQHHHMVVYFDVKVGLDGAAARAAARKSLASRLPWADVHTDTLGISAEVAAFIQTHGQSGVAEHMPDEWLDAFCAAGTPQQVSAGIQRVVQAGADSVVFQPLDGDPDCLDEYIRYLSPFLKH